MDCKQGAERGRKAWNMLNLAIIVTSTRKFYCFNIISKFRVRTLIHQLLKSVLLQWGGTLAVSHKLAAVIFLQLVYFHCNIVLLNDWQSIRRQYGYNYSKIVGSSILCNSTVPSTFGDGSSRLSGAKSPEFLQPFYTHDARTRCLPFPDPPRSRPLIFLFFHLELWLLSLFNSYIFASSYTTISKTIWILVLCETLNQKLHFFATKIC